MDADDLARGRAMLDKVRSATGGSVEDWLDAKHEWQEWASTHAAALLDAAERAARLEAAVARYEEALWDIAYAEPASRVHASLKSYVYRTQGKARVALVREQRPKGDGDE